MKATDLRGILGYIARFRDRLFVLNVDSAVLADDAFRHVLIDLSVLHSLNIHVVLVFGASRRIEQLAAERGVTPSDLEGMGVTDADTLELAVTAAQRLAHDWLNGLAETNIRAAITNAMIAHPAGIRGGRDHGFTGKVERVDTEALRALLAARMVPVVPPLGVDGNGQTYRVNSDQVAVAVAEALKADKLMFITTHNGVEGGGTLSTQFSVEEATAYLAAAGDTLPVALRSNLEHGVHACRNGVQRVHVINGLEDESLLNELFSNEGVGTMIYANEYQSIRPAGKKDVEAILGLIREAVAADELMARSREQVLAQLDDFYVFEIDGHIVGCVAVHREAGADSAELQCLFVAEAHANQGIGGKLMRFAEQRARAAGCRRLFALSTQAFNYFQQQGGFAPGDVEGLPPERRRRYEESGRRSRILYKALTDAAHDAG